MNNWYKNFDWILVLCWIALTLIGLAAIYSATQGPVSQFLPSYIQENFFKQLLWVAISIVILIIVQFTAPRTFQQGSYLFYAFCILLMISTLLFGVEINGARSWISIAGVRFQVSEIMKIGTILAVSNYLTSRRNISAEKLSSALVAVGIILLPTGLTLLQNDTGTALVLLSLIPVMLFWSGLPRGISLFIISPAIIGYFAVIQWYWGILAVLIVSIAVFLIQKRTWLTLTSLIFGIIIVAGVHIALYQVLEPHQRARIEAFTNPSFDPHGAGWNVIQAKTAIGSGGLTGKGFMKGTQTQLRFLPEQWTDFIYCVIGEEFGFIGASIVIIIFLIMLMRLLNVAGSHNHPFAQLVIVGIASIFFVHILINIGSAMGLLPVIGIPLPFISYGGSAFMSNTFMLAIALNMELYHRDFSIFV
ncbi:MAG TPA: rod shape-determining protein RodA [Balneolales bacterium]|nr:rod shape-determining protein RodA [Balneolales bacterium]